MTPDLELSWTLEFLDEITDNLQPKYWAGSGDLTITETDGSVSTYTGMNGVVQLQTPRERAGDGVKITAEMDATDLNVRNQLRRDIGPLQIRIRWIWYDNRTIPGNDGIDLLVNRERYWPTDDVMVYQATINGFRNPADDDDVFPVRFRSVGLETNAQLDTTYYCRIDTQTYAGQGWIVCGFYDTETNATNAPDSTFPWQKNNPGRLILTSDGAGVSVGRFNASNVVEERAGGWRLTGKEFIGRLSEPILRGKTYTVNVESLITDIDRGRVVNWSHDTQKARYPNDEGFAFLKSLAEGLELKWPPT